MSEMKSDPLHKGVKARSKKQRKGMKKEMGHSLSFKGCGIGK